MPYQKNKQQAFQAAQASVNEAKEDFSHLLRDDADYGSQLEHGKQEVEEAIQQIQKAMATASEHQRGQLQQYMEDLKKLQQAE
ncbi:hypothetical protein [Peribacillus glennii]|uniref:Small, acid-soluble spore protein N n=1 Tax=Peribacillus glennii TaxID=2303991 RepID=A0A372L717_9BACI|nr:hypothetical protein [Peribacillus glennii]RFU60586.1 hypothetical protein D0466_21200 [Peribacillus glennii]